MQRRGRQLWKVPGCGRRLLALEFGASVSVGAAWEGGWLSV